MAPAMRTCATIEERQANLSTKLARAANLLRTRVDVELEQQNRNLLQSMNERAVTIDGIDHQLGDEDHHLQRYIELGRQAS